MMKTAKMQVNLVDVMGSDLSVVNAARVSFNKTSGWDWSYDISDAGDPYRIATLKSSDAKLINYLAKNKHFSPFNHTFVSFRIKAPIFVSRQLVKHKFLPWNEVSRRYVDEQPEFYFPEVWRKKGDNVKQGSSDEAVYGNAEWIKASDYHVKTLAIMYENMISSGICPEQARMILPQNMMTEWIWSGTLGAYADMLRLRLDPHTQKETRYVAEEIYKQLEPKFPVSLKALLENHH